MTQSGRYLSLNEGKNINIQKVLIVSDREKNSTSNEPICIESKLSFYGLLGQKLIFRPPTK